MRAIWSAVTVLAVASLLFGCGSSGGGGTGAANRTAPEGATQTTGTRTGPAEPTPPAPAGATAHPCSTQQVEALRVTGVDCATGRAVTAAWLAEQSCRPASGASHAACSIEGYRCLGAVGDRGIAAFCVQQGKAIVFLVKPG